jgi:hypothetical protein
MRNGIFGLNKKKTSMLTNATEGREVKHSAHNKKKPKREKMFPLCTWMKEPEAYIFDFDGVLFDPLRNALYPQVPLLLKRLKQSGHFVALASRREDTPESKHFICQMLKEAGVLGLCDAIEVGDVNKAIHVRSILRKCGIKRNTTRLVFFDNEPENLSQVREAFPLCVTVLISQKTGVQPSDIH